MSDGRKNNGGAREGAGRKSKAEEIARIEMMDSVSGESKKAWENLWELCEDKNIAALKIWIEYRFGKPKDRLDLTTDDEPLNNVFELSKLNDKQLEALIALHGGSNTSTETP